MSKLALLCLAALLMIAGVWLTKVVSSSVFAASNNGYGPMHEPSGPLKDIKTQMDLENWTTYYYLYPQPDLTVKAIFFSEQVGFMDCPNAAAPLIGFFGQIFAANPGKLQAWVQDLKPLKQIHKNIIYTALWLANTNESKTQAAILLKQLAPDMQASITKSTAKHVAVEHMEINSPAVLDMLWASFFATGDERYVKRIMSVLPWFGSSEHNGAKTLIAGTAKWSLTCNARQHKRVLQICEKERNCQPALKNALNEVIAEATKPLEQNKHSQSIGKNLNQSNK